jgi:hypothetical protein
MWMKMSQEGWPLDQRPSQLDRCVRGIVVRCTFGQTACNSRKLNLPVGQWSWDWQVAFGECTSETLGSNADHNTVCVWVAQEESQKWSWDVDGRELFCGSWVCKWKTRWHRCFSYSVPYSQLDPLDLSQHVGRRAWGPMQQWCLQGGTISKMRSFKSLRVGSLVWHFTTPNT